MALNVTYDLDEDDVTVLHQPINASTPEDVQTDATASGEGVATAKLRLSPDDKEPAWKRVRFDEDAASPDCTEKSPPLGLPVWTQEALDKAGLTPKRVRTKGFVSVAPVQNCAVNSPVPTTKTWTNDALEKAGLTPQRVPVKGHTPAMTCSVYSPAPARRIWTKEALEKAGMTPQRVPLKNRDEGLRKSVLTPGRMPSKSCANTPTKSVISPAPGLHVWTKEALDKAGLTPQRVSVTRNNANKSEHSIRPPLGQMNGRVSLFASHTGARDRFGRREVGDSKDALLKKEEVPRRQTWNCGLGARDARESLSVSPDDEDAFPVERRIDFDAEAGR